MYMYEHTYVYVHAYIYIVVTMKQFSEYKVLYIVHVEL